MIFFAEHAAQQPVEIEAGDREVCVERRGLGCGFDRHLKRGWRAIFHSVISFRNRTREFYERLKRLFLLWSGGGFSDELGEAFVI